MALPESGDGRFFGVVAIRQGWEVEQVAPAEALYDIGCTARLQAVRPQPDGGFRIVTVGGDRFRLLDVVVGDDPPYLQAEVEWLDEEEAAEEAAGDTDGVVTELGTHVAALGPELTDPEPLADVVASTAQGSMDGPGPRRAGAVHPLRVRGGRPQLPAATTPAPGEAAVTRRPPSWWGRSPTTPRRCPTSWRRWRC